MSSVVSFKKNINNLRAIAVIGVVLFHFNNSWIPGGFGGVDAFFVISGYLMTSIIFKKIEIDRFSVLDFYKARSHRIVPPLIVLCITMLIAGYFLLSPYEYSNLSKHSSAALTFISNFVFFKESGYFDAASHTKWLLHTWSLSAEWQFYLVYPLIIVLLLKLFTLKTIRTLLLVFTVLSFLISIYSTLQWPSAAYYLLPSRAWEMLMGGIAFLFPLQQYRHAAKIQYTGLALVLMSYFLFDSNSQWPGYLALLPVIGAYFIIISDKNDTYFSRNQYLHYLGLWSYSIYLWHWPIVVAISTYQLGISGIAIGLILSIVLGAISYYTIESVQFKKLSGFKEYSYLIIAGITLIISLYIYLNNGLSSRYSKGFNAISASASASPQRSACHTTAKHIPVPPCQLVNPAYTAHWASIGDSHSVELAYALGVALEKNKSSVYQYSYSGCLANHEKFSIHQKCTKQYQQSIREILHNQDIENVVISHRWFSKEKIQTLQPELAEPQAQVTEALIQTIQDISKTKKVFVVLPIPEPGMDINLLLSQYYRQNKTFTSAHGETVQAYMQRNNVLIDAFQAADFNSNVYLVNTSEIFCPAGQCFTVEDSKSLYFDDNHPSIYGAAKIADKIIELSRHALTAQ